MDATLGRTLGLVDGQRVAVSVHVEPPLVHTLNIEPLTPEDWEMVELHAQSLELNLIAQVRAVPNPAFAPAGIAIAPYPLILHLTPTTFATVKVTSIEPALATEMPFAKISPNSEVIVAPKSRTQAGKSIGDHHSIASTRKSGKSAGASRKRIEERPPLFFRGLDSGVCQDWLESGDSTQAYQVWVDAESVTEMDLKGIQYVVVNVLRPVGLQISSREGGQAAATDRGIATKAIAKLQPWDYAPNTQVVALSPALCTALGCTGMVGGVVKIQVASDPLSTGAVKKLRVYPFIANGKAQEGFRFGGESKAEKEEAAKRFRQIYGGKGGGGVLRGPLTDGLVLAPSDDLSAGRGWEGGVMRLEYDGAPSGQDKEPEIPRWCMSLDSSVAIEFQPPVPRPSWILEEEPYDRTPTHTTILAGIDTLLQSLETHLLRGSSTLLTGAMGSGKTAVAKYIAQELRSTHFYTTLYLSCGTLVSDATSKIKETLMKLFMTAAWGSRMGGKAIVILDDLHKLCKAETELQVGGENSRNKLISEVVCGIVRQHCGRDSGVVLLATAESKAALDSVVVSGHIVGDMLELKAPDREGRRKVLEAIVRQDIPSASTVESSTTPKLQNGSSSRPSTSDGDAYAEAAGWTNSEESAGDGTPNGPGFVLSADLGFLDVAALTDGYMPADLKVLVSRAQKEAVLATINDTSSHPSDHILLTRTHFDLALNGFTPASLRNVSLQTSKTTFASIGGLRETRRILLETLEYPTKYAPIFARCPLRLRSGLLLYGYPGCGKTLLASAVAGECGLNFISVKGPEILNKYIGASEKSVRDLFERAQAAKPCVLFFDEFDSIAPRRGHDSTGVTDRVVNQLLVQMDGAEGLSGVYVLAATSRPDLIDPALLRPGRLDKSIICDLPDFADRMDILTALSSQMKLSEEVTVTDEPFEEIARRTEGYSGADLAALVGNAQLAAIRDVLNSETTGTGHRNSRERGRQASGRLKSESFIQFDYGSQESGSATKGPTPTEMVAIRAKLDGLRLARKRAREAKRGPAATDKDGHTSSSGTEVVIKWVNIEEALRETGPSMSETERRRLEKIYREFVTGRSGDMKDGQASAEVGGRSSLA